MCGIVGVSGRTAALPFVRDGLGRLEYRGYDSAGIALVGDDLAIHKCAGTVDDIDLPESHPATTAIGHTRWSTHGPPTDANAHPHTDPGGRVAVVHNGVVENHDALADDYGPYTSDTDTEVIAHLLAAELDDADALDAPDGDALRAAMERTADRLDGSFAVAAVAAGCDAIVAARRDSPLVLGHGDDAQYLASDVPALVDRTREVSYLEDGDVATLTPEGTTVHSHGEEVDRPVETVDWDPEAAEKGGYEHYMRKEIHEQPVALRRTLAGRADEPDGVDWPVGIDPGAIEAIQIVACGTSYYAGQFAARLFEDRAGIPATAHVASEYAFGAARDPDSTLLIGVTQSGETADTLAALRSASRAGAPTLAVTNTVGSTVTREADGATFIRAGPEIGVAATKTFAAQVATLALLAVRCGRDRGVLSDPDAAALLADLRALPGAVQQLLDAEDALRGVAERYVDADAFFFVGRRLGYPVAMEGALKLKEIAYVHAEGFPAGELKHGPLALVTPETPVFALLTAGTNPERTLTTVKEVASRGAPVVGLTSHEPAERYLDDAVAIPPIGPFEPLVANVALQLFAYHVAARMDRPIDRPRNLAKSVTVE